MEWEFRKILANIESYRTGTPRFIAEIQKSSPGVLKTIVREIQLIISDPNANILSKVLAIRFARDIMILGKQDVINQLSKLVPHMLKVCSYRLQSEDLNRGESYFYDHPQYLNASSSEKQQIQRYGSTYFILNLQSIYHWGNWIKVDENGNQSIYSKGLQSLKDRGVHFHNNFNYYKNSDTEKFRNTYKVQFFSQDSVDLDSSRHLSSQKSSKSQTSNQYRQAQNIKVLKNNLYNLQTQGAKRYDKLQKFNKNAITLLQQKYSQNVNGKDKLDKQWLQQYIVNYNLMENNKISYEQFMRRATTQTIEIPQKSQVEYTSRQMVDTNNNFKKVKSSAKRQLLGRSDINGSRQASYSPDNALRPQQQGLQQLKQRYRMQIQALNDRLQQERAQHEMQKNHIVQSCQERLRNIKQQIGSNNANKNQGFIKQNQKLKQKLYQLQKSMKVSRSRQHENQSLSQAYDQLKIQHENLRKSARRNDETLNSNTLMQLNQKIKRLQRQLQNQKNENQIILQKVPNENQISKKNKQIMNLNDELNIYKNSIREQREEFDRKYKQLQQKCNNLDTEVRSLKQKNKTLQKKLDLRDIEAIQMGEQVKLFKELNRQNQPTIKSKSHINNNIQGEGSALKLGNTSQQHQMYSGITDKQPTNYDFKKYQPLRNQILKGDKERFLRFCRCCLKKKDLLLKQNQLEIGIISQPISNNEVKFVIHLTNTSDTQINEIRVRCDTDFNQYQIGLETQYIFCLQASQQEKFTLFCRVMHSFLNNTYLPIFIIIQYIKNSKPYTTKVLVPFVLFKTIEIYKSDNSHELNSRDQLTLTFPHSQKILSDTKYLFSFFPGMQETSKNKFECDLLFRETSSRYRLGIILKQDHQMTVMLTPLGQTSISPKQKQMLEQDLMGFLELCFRK